MAKRAAPLKQADATRMFRAARAAGYGAARIIIHPDGRIEVEASETETIKKNSESNSWDEVLR